MHKLEVNRRIRKWPPESSWAVFDSSLPLVLTHLDIHPNNIIIGDDGRVWLIDWEFAGFYPQWFEYASMREGWDILGKWGVWILGFMAGFYEKQLRFIASIWWAAGQRFLSVGWQVSALNNNLLIFANQVLG